MGMGRLILVDVFLQCDGFPRRIHLIFKSCRLNNIRSLFKILPIDQKSNLSIELIQYKSLLCFLLCKTLCRQIRILEHSVLISFVQNAKYYLVASEEIIWKERWLKKIIFGFIWSKQLCLLCNSNDPRWTA